MKLLLLPLFASLRLALAQKIAAEPSVDVAVHPLNSSIAIDVRIDVEDVPPWVPPVAPARLGSASFVLGSARYRYR